MKLDKKKRLAKRMFGVGLDRIVFKKNLEDIKEAITREDLRQLLKSGAIVIKQEKKKKRRAGRKRMLRGKKGRKRGIGKKRKIIKDNVEYLIRIRKLRMYLKKLKQEKKISSEDYNKLRKAVKSGSYKNIKQLQEAIK